MLARLLEALWEGFQKIKVRIGKFKKNNILMYLIHNGGGGGGGTMFYALTNLPNFGNQIK